MTVTVTEQLTQVTDKRSTHQLTALRWAAFYATHKLLSCTLQKTIKTKFTKNNFKDLYDSLKKVLGKYFNTQLVTIFSVNRMKYKLSQW